MKRLTLVTARRRRRLNDERSFAGEKQAKIYSFSI